MSETRSYADTKHLVDTAIEVMRGTMQPQATVLQRDSVQAGRSRECDWLDWACWFFKCADNMNPHQQHHFAAYIGKVEWHPSMQRKAEHAIYVFGQLVPDPLWRQGESIANELW